jgi:WD40 repeat protein
MRHPFARFAFVAGLILLVCPSLLSAARDAKLSLEAHEHGTRCVAFSPDGKLLASGGDDKTVKLWSMPSGKLTLTVQHPQTVKSLAFSHNGKLLATGDAGENTRVWDIAGGKAICEIKDTADARRVFFSPDDKQVITGGSSTVQTWDIVTGKRLRWFALPSQPVDMSISPDGRDIVVGYEQGPMQVFDAATGKEARKIDAHGSVRGVSVSPDGRMVAVTIGDGHILLLDLKSGEETNNLYSADSRNTFVAFSTDGRKLVTASSNTAIVWDIAQEKASAKLTRENWFVQMPAVAISPHNTLVAVATSEKELRIWDISATAVKKPAEAPPAIAENPVEPATPEKPKAPASAKPDQPAKPAAKPAVATAEMAAIAGRWKISKTVSITLEAGGTIKTGYRDMHNGTWTVDADRTVSLRSKAGVLIYTMHLDESGKSGTGLWKDGTKAKPEKLVE